MIAAEVLFHSICHQQSLSTNMSSKLCFIPTCVAFLLSGVHGIGRKDKDLDPNPKHEKDAILV